MKSTFLEKRKHFMLMGLLIILSACNQSEFYEKEGLSEIKAPPTGSLPPGVGFEETDDGQGDDGNGDKDDEGNEDDDTDETGTPPTTTGPVNPPTNPPKPTEPPVEEIYLQSRSESFTQNVATRHAVDILWVIDDSGSMANEQKALADNFESFINQFVEKDVDFRMGITTTDGTTSKNGRMVGDSTKLTSEEAKKNRSQFLSNFKNWVKVGTRGSGREQGLMTSESFINRYGSSFLRNDAVLAIVYLSDEEDASPKTVTSYIESLQSNKQNKAHVKAYSIIVQKNNVGSGESYGSRYESISKQTAGLVTDIKKNFASTLLDIGGEIVTLLDSFALNETPYNNEVKVFINGQEVITGWTFNPTQRSVTFNKDQLPKAGSKIDIQYQVKLNVLGAN